MALFLEQMRHEKRRAERTKAPLSIVIIDLNSKESSKVSLSLLESVADRIRDTDTIGFLGEYKIGILLPDTNKTGAEEAMKKIIDKDKSLFNNNNIIATYPDRIFDSLSVKNLNQQEIDALFYEDYMESISFTIIVKRGIDILGSTIGIMLLSPLMVITTLLIKMDSPGPAIFKQLRLGKKCIPFVFYKFRSMRCEADDNIHRDYVANLIKGDSHEVNQGDVDKPFYKIKDDPRVTRVGKFIRKTSLDELPQLFNVLKGEMSLVGPRPPLFYEVEKYEPWHLRRILVKRPGITGLWQVEGRSKTTFDEMVRMDIQYVRKCSIWLDFKILLKTIKVIFLQSGAV